MTSPQFSAAPLTTSDLNAAPDTKAHAEVKQGGDGYPGVRVINTDNVPLPPQDITVTLPDYHGLHFPSWWDLSLSVQNPPSGDTRSVAGVLSADGKTVTYTGVDLKMQQQGDRAIMWVAVHADPDAAPGDTALQFAIGQQGSFPAALTVLGTNSPPPPPPPSLPIKYGDTVYLQCDNSLYLSGGGGRLSAVAQPGGKSAWTILNSSGEATRIPVQNLAHACLQASDHSYLIDDGTGLPALGNNVQQGNFLAVALRSADDQPITYDSPFLINYNNAHCVTAENNGQVNFTNGGAPGSHWSARVPT
ncbi:hypothetical protein [Streptomyces violascens]|uniref:hypothetical protein n=1 Tax=Streptomyces violascens TaxID=67381 RepID=UPI0036C71C13